MGREISESTSPYSDGDILICFLRTVKKMNGLISNKNSATGVASYSLGARRILNFELRIAEWRVGEEVGLSSQLSPLFEMPADHTPS
jgi:hypothetical protein